MADTRREMSTLQTSEADNTSGAITAQVMRDHLVTNHGQNQHPTSAFASAPSTPVTGDLWAPSDGVSLYRYSGSAWVPWGALFPLAEPTLQTFAWINQGSSTVSTTNGGIYLNRPSAAGVNLAIRKKTAPATPYTITAMLLPNFYDPTSIPIMGLCFRQSSDGKLHTFHNYINSGSWAMGTSKYSSPTAFSADYTAASTSIGVPTGLFLRIADDGTNRICSFSHDGQNFYQFHSVGRTDYLTADEVGWVVGNYNGTLQVSAMLVHWKEG